jgi:hypothetical protein
MAEHSLVAEGASPASISLPDYRDCPAGTARGLTKKLYDSQKEVYQPGNKRAKWVYTINLTGTLLTISRHDLVLLQIQDRTTCTTTTGICGMRVSGLGLDGGSSSSSSSLRCYMGYALI